MTTIEVRAITFEPDYLASVAFAEGPLIYIVYLLGGCVSHRYPRCAKRLLALKLAQVMARIGASLGAGVLYS